MRFTKKEVSNIKFWWPHVKSKMTGPETRENLLYYGIYAGRMIEILFRRVNLDKPEGTDDYIKETLGKDVFKWYSKGHKNFIFKGEKDK